MGKIVAIGGGEIGRPGTKVETTPIDRRIIELSGKKRPKLLFVPTATNDSERYCTVIQKHFGKRLGCKIEFLLLYKEQYTKAQLREKILGADIIYVGGGNTLRMMMRWRKMGVDKLLKQAYKQETVMCGLSAGAICWFRFGNSDSRLFTSNSKQLIRVSGIRLYDLLLCPHYDEEKHRQMDLRRMMRTTPGVALALDSCAAIEIVDDRWRIITSKKTAQARRIYYRHGALHEELLPIGKDSWSMASLVQK